MACHARDSVRIEILRGDSLIKVGTDAQAQALGISGVNFCPGINFGK